MSSGVRSLAAGMAAAAAAAGVVLLLWWWRGPGSSSGPAGGDRFVEVMNSGRTFYEKGEAARAAELFGEAVRLQPANPDGRLNLANARLRLGQAAEALEQARWVQAQDPQLAAAHYLAGCARLRLRAFEEGLKDLQAAKDLDPTVNAVTFQIGRVLFELGKWEESVAALQEVLQFDAEHTAAAYSLSQALLRAGRREEGDAALQRYQQLVAGKPNLSTDPSTWEQCRYTEMRSVFVLEQPAPEGVAVRFREETGRVFGGKGAAYRGPVAVLDLVHDGRNSLFVMEAGQGFRLLDNRGGGFEAGTDPVPGVSGGRYYRALVGDLHNDRVEDVLVVGDLGSHVFKLSTNGLMTDQTLFSQIGGLKAVDGVLADLDFTGKLDLLAVGSEGGGVRVWRNLGGAYFTDITATSGIPGSVSGVTGIRMDDWNHDDLGDVLLSGAAGGAGASMWLKQRGGPLMATNLPAAWGQGRFLGTSDLDNDLRVDLILGVGGGIRVVSGLTGEVRDVASGVGPVEWVVPMDYDNDGWTDVLAGGEGLQLWRNRGTSGFLAVTVATGLDAVRGTVVAAHPADYDNDGDVDLVLDRGGAGLGYWQNEGGNANQLLKVHLVGNRSNASGLGVRLELTAGNWRTSRTVDRLPVEIGVGSRTKVDAVTVRWFDLALNSVDLAVDPRVPVPLIELQLPTGSCPYLYAWNGRRFEFVTDLLGAAPMGLPVAAGRYIEADPDEVVWLGDERTFPPRGGVYELRVTEELREVLYLDTAALWVVDHPEGTEVHPTSKLVPGKPFPEHGVWTLHRERPLVRAVRSDGLEVTERLRARDGDRVSPVRLRPPQIRGLAEPYSVELDFGEIEAGRPWVLAMDGWLRFGGGMANIAASHHRDFPFPFPRLEVETGPGVWKPVDAVVGAPAGKTKTILADLTGKLPAGSRRLRLSMAFEIHWDRIALMERASEAGTTIRRLTPDRAELGWRGFSRFLEGPVDQPLTPDYEAVEGAPPWRILPSGWCTRYGDVGELVRDRDNSLALLNGGDSLALSFRADRLGAVEAGSKRDFFLYTVGWDKDADFHVKLGDQVGPLPWLGMDDQRYGVEQRPVFANDDWIGRYNTRWVGPVALRRPVQAEAAKTSASSR